MENKTDQLSVVSSALLIIFNNNKDIYFNYFILVHIISSQGSFCCSSSSPWSSPCMRSRSWPCPLLCHHWLGLFASTNFWLILNDLPSTTFTDDLFCQLFGSTKFGLFTFGLSGVGSDEEHRWCQPWTLQQDHCSGNQQPKQPNITKEFLKLCNL